MKLNQQYETKAILFLDVLGFSNLVESKKSEGPQWILNEVLQYMSEGYIKNELINNKTAVLFPTVKKIHPDLNYQSIQISDSFVASVESSPVGIINLIHIAKSIQMKLLLKKKLLVRGYIDVGEIYHKENQFFGPGFIKVVEKEKKAMHLGHVRAPVIEISKAIEDIINEDKNIKRTFEEMTTKDSDGSIATNPFSFINTLLSVHFSDLEKNIESCNLILDTYEKWVNEYLSQQTNTTNVQQKEDISSGVMDKYIYLQKAIQEQRKILLSSKDSVERLKLPAIKLRLPAL